MNINSIITEAQAHPNPNGFSDIYSFVQSLQKGDNVYIKRNNGDNINLSILEPISSNHPKFKVKKGKDQFNIMVFDTDPKTLYVEEFDKASNSMVSFKYKDIKHITASDKQFLKKSFYSENNQQQNQQQNQNQGQGQSQGQSQPTPQSSNVTSALESLKAFIDAQTFAVLSLINDPNSTIGKSIVNIQKYLAKYKQFVTNSNQNSSKGQQQQQPQINYQSLSQFLKWDGGKWVTSIGNGTANSTLTPQKFSGQPKELGKLLSDVLLVCKTGDMLNLSINASLTYKCLLEVKNQVVKLQSVSPNILISGVKGQPSQIYISGTFTDYTQTNVVRVGNKNKLSLSLFKNSVGSSNFVNDIEGIYEFTYLTSAPTVSRSDMAEKMFLSLENSLEKLPESFKITFTVREYTTPDDSTETEIVLIGEQKDDVFEITDSNISELKGKTFNSASIVPSVDETSGDLSGTVFATFEGMAFGFIEGIRVSKRGEDGAFDDSDNENEITQITDKELYQIVMSDPTLKSFVIKKPSFWEWMKHRKNNFKNVNLDAGYFKNIIRNIGQGDNEGYVTDHKFKLKVVDSNGNDGVYSNGYQISDGMSMLTKIKSANNNTIFHVFKTVNSKPSLIIKTKQNVYDIKTNKLDNMFVGDVYDSTGKVIGEMKFSIS